MNASAEQLPAPSLLSRCGEAWGLRNMVFVRKMENIVFVCDRHTEKLYLRLTSPLRRRHPEIEAELNWIEHLAKWGLRVPQLIPNREGKRITSFTEGEQHFEAVVFSEMRGEHPSKEMASDPQFLKTLGALIATMHQASECYEKTPRAKREEWFEERGLRHALAAAAVSEHSTLRRGLEERTAWMRQLQKTPTTYGLIHADLGALNLFLEKDGSIGLIDFDDSCYHWFAFDLAIVIFSMAGRHGHVTSQPEEKQWLANLLEGYRRVRLLSQEEVDLIFSFIHFACLRLFFWIEHHESLHTFHEDALDKVAQLKQWTKLRIESTEIF